MRPHLSVLCLLAICELTEIIDSIPRSDAWAAKPHIAARHANTKAYRRYWRKRI